MGRRGQYGAVDCLFVIYIHFVLYGTVIMNLNVKIRNLLVIITIT
jgi:hypothetical protein